MRDYNQEFRDTEHRQYAYDFDSVVRRYMMRTLNPYFVGGNALELGCYEGESTALFAEHFPDLTVLEASDELSRIAKLRVPESVRFIHGTIESATMDVEFDNIFLVHTLEHLDDPSSALMRIRSWLSPRGRLFVVVPNAMAASRQIAVKMGLIATNHDVTAAEQSHGHRRTYSLDTLEHDVRSAGLNIESRGGIVFKPFANFQFDLLLKHNIIDSAYIEGCYALGMHYPELSASVFTVCKRA